MLITKDVNNIYYPFDRHFATYVCSRGGFVLKQLIIPGGNTAGEMFHFSRNKK